MTARVLFSPVGKADPITALGDGPMLHIVRHYRPDVVALLLSPDMAGYEQADHRYSRAIRRVAKGRTEGGGRYEPEIRHIESTTVDVHRYDLHIREFRQCLNELAAEFPEATLLLNVSSGTPGMQHALVAMDAFGAQRTTAIQVPTPSGAMGRRGDRENPKTYDLDLAWDANPDNAPSATNRCVEVASPHLGALLQRENVKRLIQAYDYGAAARLADGALLPPDIRGIIEGAASRVTLDHQAGVGRFVGTEFAYSREDSLQEYVSMLEVLMAREQWAEFAVRITPAVTETLFRMLRPKLPDDKYLTVGKTGRRLDRNKIEADDRLSQALDLRRGQDSPPVTNHNLTKLISEYCESGDAQEAEVLRGFETGVRNYAAHELRCVDKRRMEKDGKCPVDRVVEILARRAGVRRGLYTRINAEVVRLVDGSSLHR